MIISERDFKEFGISPFDEELEDEGDKGSQGQSDKVSEGDPWADVAQMIAQAETEGAMLLGETNQLSDEERSQLRDLQNRNNRLQPIEIQERVYGSARIPGNVFSIDTRNLFSGIGNAVGNVTEAVVNNERRKRREGDPDKVASATEKKNDALAKLAELEQVSDPLENAGVPSIHKEAMADLQRQIEKQDKLINRYTGVTDKISSMLEQDEQAKRTEAMKRAYVSKRVDQLMDDKLLKDRESQRSQNRITEIERRFELEKEANQPTNNGSDGGNDGIKSTATDRRRTYSLLETDFDMASRNIEDYDETIREIEAGNINYSKDQIDKLKAKRNQWVAFRRELQPLLSDASEQLNLTGTYDRSIDKKLSDITDKYYELLGYKVNSDQGTIEFDQAMFGPKSWGTDGAQPRPPLRPDIKTDLTGL